MVLDCYMRLSCIYDIVMLCCFYMVLYGCYRVLRVYIWGINENIYGI